MAIPEITAEGADGGKLARGGDVGQSLRAAGREEGADIRRGQRFQQGEVCGAALRFVQVREEAAQCRAVGAQRVGGKATLVGEAGEPAFDEVACIHQAMVSPVFAQSARNCSRPRSVSGCLASAFSTAGGAVTTSAPILAACRMCTGWRTEATRISV